MEGAHNSLSSVNLESLRELQSHLAVLIEPIAQHKISIRLLGPSQKPGLLDIDQTSETS